MADAADAATATVTKVKSLVTLIEDLTGKSKDADTEATADPGGAHAAVAAYRKTARWILAAFAAVALVVFGTLPFANVTRLQGFWHHLWLLLGLLFVAVGVVLAVRAVASTMTPVSASLGELVAESGPPPLLPAQPTPLRPQPLTVPTTRTTEPSSSTSGFKRALARIQGWVGGWWQDTFSQEIRTAEMKRLITVLLGAENQSHLGPGVSDVPDLIVKITEQDAARFVQLPAAEAAAVDLQAATDRQTLLAAQLAALEKQLMEVAAGPETGERAALVARLTARTAALATEIDAARTELRAAMTTARAHGVELAQTLARREIYLFHREMVVDQYGVSLVRAAFLRARSMLVVAAALTLLGATVYALALPPDPDDEEEPAAAAPAAAAALEPAPAVTLTLDVDGEAYQVLPASCRRAGDLTGYLISGLPLEPNGPATVVLSSGDCAGHQLQVEEKDGTLALQD